jgi:hypothetical protein
VSVQVLNTAYDPSSGVIAVAGQVVGVVSDSGICTATATQDAQPVTAEAPGMANTAETYCNVSVTLPGGSTGTWNIELSFADATHSGTVSSTIEAG